MVWAIHKNNSWAMNISLPWLFSGSLPFFEINSSPGLYSRKNGITSWQETLSYAYYRRWFSIFYITHEHINTSFICERFKEIPHITSYSLDRLITILAYFFCNMGSMILVCVFHNIWGKRKSWQALLCNHRHLGRSRCLYRKLRLLVSWRIHLKETWKARKQEKKQCPLLFVEPCFIYLCRVYMLHVLS